MLWKKGLLLFIYSALNKFPLSSKTGGNYIDIYGSNYIELRAYYVNDIDYYGMKMRETYAVSDDVDE